MSAKNSKRNKNVYKQREKVHQARPQAEETYVPSLKLPIGTELLCPLTVAQLENVPWIVARYMQNPYAKKSELDSLVLNFEHFRVSAEESAVRLALYMISVGYILSAGRYYFDLGYFRWRRHNFTEKGSWVQFMSGANVWYTWDMPITDGTPTSYISQGHQALPLSYVGHNERIYGLREKIDGVRFDRYNHGDRAYLQGPFSLEIPWDFPVECAEFYKGHFYVLYPYQVEPMEYGNFKFLPHPWRTEVANASEGLMVLTTSGEYKLKWAPTVEIQVHLGVWISDPTLKVVGTEYTGIIEVRYDFETGDFVFVAERDGAAKTYNPNDLLLESDLNLFEGIKAQGVLEYGDKTSYNEKTRKFVVASGRRAYKSYSKVSPSYHNPYYLNVHKYPEWVQLGEWEVNLSSISWKFIRTKVELPVLYTEDEALNRFHEWFRLNNMEYKDSKLIGVPFHNVKHGVPLSYSAKLIPYDSMGRIGLLEEKGKLLDFPGGKTNPGEDPWATITREYQEELGVLLTGERFVGSTCAAPWVTYLFEKEEHDVDLKWFGPNDRLKFADCVEWLPRLLMYWLSKHVGAFLPYSTTLFSRFSDSLLFCDGLYWKCSMRDKQKVEQMYVHVRLQYEAGDVWRVYPCT